MQKGNPMEQTSESSQAGAVAPASLSYVAPSLFEYEVVALPEVTSVAKGAGAKGAGTKARRKGASSGNLPIVSDSLAGEALAFRPVVYEDVPLTWSVPAPTKSVAAEPSAAQPAESAESADVETAGATPDQTHAEPAVDSIDAAPASDAEAPAEGAEASEQLRVSAFRLHEHMVRLVRAARVFGVGRVPAPKDLDICLTNYLEALAASHPAAQPCALRVALTVPAGELVVAGVAPPENPHASRNPADGLVVGVSSWRHVSADCLPVAYGSTARDAALAAAASEAERAGWDDAVLLTQAGLVCEALGGAVFSVRDGVLATPPQSDGARDAVMRDVVLNIALDLEIPVIEESIDRSVLASSDEVFIAGDLTGIRPVRILDGCRIAPADASAPHAKHNKKCSSDASEGWHPGSYTQAVLERDRALRAGEFSAGASNR